MRELKQTGTLLTGHPIVDSDHARLIFTINECVSAFQADDFRLCADLVWEFGERLVEHFSSEEEIMSGLGYENLVEHKQAHHRNLADYQDIRRRCGDESFVAGCIDNLKGVLIKDMISSDMDFKSHLAEIGFRP